MTDPLHRSRLAPTFPPMNADADIRVEILPMPRGRVSCEIVADGELWGVTVENRAEAWAVAFASVRGIIRARRLREELAAYGHSKNRPFRAE